MSRKRRAPRPPPVARSVPRDTRPTAAVAAAVRADERLAPRDRGPVRAFVRDVVDARRSVLVALPLAFGGALIATLGPSSELQRWLQVACVAALAVLVLVAIRFAVTVVAATRAAHPDLQVSGPATGWYAVMRASRPRSTRTPRARVGPGRD